MKKSILLLGTMALGLAACGDTSEPEAITTEDAIPVEPDGGIGDGAAAPADATDATDEMEQTIPAALQGRWGLVPNDCKPEYASAAKGLLVIGPETLKFYESVGTLTAVKERDVTRLAGTFAFNGEGMEWTRDETLDVQDDGQTLIRREYGDDALPGPFKYGKCP